MRETKFWKGGANINLSSDSEVLRPGCFAPSFKPFSTIVLCSTHAGQRHPGENKLRIPKRSQRKARAREQTGTQVSCLSIKVPLGNPIKPRVSNGGRPHVGSHISSGDTASGLSKVAG